MNLASDISRSLALRSSRRQFFKFMTANSLAAGFVLARANVSLGAPVAVGV